ncbi:MAG: NAD(P)H-hydrate dehydratase [Cyanobacteria bacterium CRU_2_1]|nr:NAD(P)H-hydrate dehydratase [Cyanobacteria bacterium RU_5_0]NJR58713.1 NAD(P)H-hydrate dehydratase [Cyanobacteria bacterium CRU_2_1]
MTRLGITRLEITRLKQLQRFVVTADQMSKIEARVFDAGMPVAALMEKVGGILAQRIQSLYPLGQKPCVGILVGPGHNGGDALVVARELHLGGYAVKLYQPFAKMKDLTASHAQYAVSLGIPRFEQIEPLAACDVLVDGLFGFGLTRSLDGSIASVVDQLNQWTQPILSIDLPSGLHTDTGAALGTAIQATRSFCLGLWKRAFLQEQALEYIGQAEWIDVGLPLAEVEAVLGVPAIQRITPQMAIASLPLPRPATTHKYKQGHLLLICGSRRYAGAAILCGLAARASGVGMLSIAVPESLKSILTSQLPDALVISCLEGETGAIAQLPDDVEFGTYQAIACGPGLSPQANSVVESVLASACPLLLDADGLNTLANLGTLSMLQQRQAPTVLTPHLGEFKRLFPALTESIDDPITIVQTAAQQSGAIVLLKGARTIIANSQGSVWLNPDSTPALARGGSGDVLTGLMGGLLAQGLMCKTSIESVVQSAAWWHSQAGILAAQERTELGVDASTLIQYLIPALHRMPRS